MKPPVLQSAIPPQIEIARPSTGPTRPPRLARHPSLPPAPPPAQRRRYSHQVPHEQFHVHLASYWESLDPEEQRRLLPLPTPEQSPAAHREASLLGYKYGPVPFLLTVP